MAQSHSRGDGGGRFLLIPHHRHGFQHRTLLWRQVVEATLIKGGDAIQQNLKLLPDFGNGVVGDQFVEHDGEPGIAARHFVKRQQLGAQRIEVL